MPIKIITTLTTKGKSKKQAAMIRKAIAAGERQGRESRKKEMKRAKRIKKLKKLLGR